MDPRCTRCRFGRPRRLPVSLFICVGLLFSAVYTGMEQVTRADCCIIFTEWHRLKIRCRCDHILQEDTFLHAACIARLGLKQAHSPMNAQQRVACFTDAKIRELQCQFETTAFSLSGSALPENPYTLSYPEDFVVRNGSQLLVGYGPC